MRRVLAAALLLAATPVAPQARAQSSVVEGTLHNLSVSGPGEIRSVSEKEICKFCHIPHNAVVPVPLWGHALSRVSDYRVTTITARTGRKIPAPQPDGSSRLCLSCHDGTVALGEVGGRRIPLNIEGAQVLTPDRKGFLGTDLSGAHPISFVLAENEQRDSPESGDMGVKSLPRVQSDKDVRLDSEGKMQCTTCHDPHSDRFYRAGAVPHFWVKPSVDEVCLTCHELR